MIFKNKIIMLLGLFFLICTGGLYFALQVMMPFMWILLAIGTLGIMIAVFKNQKIIAEFFKLKTTKYGLDMGSILALTLGIIILVNFLAVKYVHVFDFSMTNQYTLSEQSKKIINNLESDVEIKYFYKDGLQNTDSAKKAFLAQAKVFQDYSNKIKISSVEMNANPAITDLYGATKGIGEGFISYKGKINSIESQFAGAAGLIYTEQNFLNSLIKSTRNKFKSIAFITGHGERDTHDEKSENSVSLFRKTLEKNAYLVQDLNLITTGKIPETTDLIIVAGATENFQKGELEVINNYLAKGKSALILFDSIKVYGPINILNNTGWDFDNGLVFNILSTAKGTVVSTDQPTVANVFSDESDITKYFGLTKSVLLYRPHAFIKSTNKIKSSFLADVILKTSDRNVILNKIDTLDYTGKPTSFNLGLYVKGIYSDASTGFVSEISLKNESELVFFSDINFASNQFFNQTSNKDLLLNTVALLAKETDLVSFAPKEPNASKIKMTGPEFNSYFKFILVGLFFPLPFVFLIFSVIIWIKRRHA